MTKKYIILAFVFFVLLLQTSDVRGGDNQRKGFILGFGLGSGLTSFENHKEDGGDNRESGWPVMFDFKIGYAIDNSWQIYWTTKNAFFRLGSGNEGNKELVAHQLAGVGCSYYLKPNAPSSYLVAGIGAARFAWAEEWTSSDRLGLFGGGGFEFSPGWSLEMHVSWDNIPGREFLSLRATVNVLYY